MINVGYCVVFNHQEQGWEGLTVIVTHEHLSTAIELVETLSGYSRDHVRYKQKVFDLTDLYHRNALKLEGTSEALAELKSFSPEAYSAAINFGRVSYTVQVHQPLGWRCWINRKWDLVKQTLEQSFEESLARRKARK